MYDPKAYPDTLIYTRKEALCSAAKSKSGKRLQPLRGKKQEAETKFFFNNARELGQLAKQLAMDSGCPVIAVLFRDTDNKSQDNAGADSSTKCNKDEQRKGG